MCEPHFMAIHAIVIETFQSEPKAADKLTDIAATLRA